jgi:pyruvate formate-lyase/glycerol dehydratase family glycyl radical enzyme
MNIRIMKLRQKLLESIPSVDIHRARLITKAYQEAIGEPMAIVRGKSLYKIFTEMPIFIHEDELVVGSATISPRAAQLFPEVQAGWLDQELDTVSNREYDPLLLPEKDKEELRHKILPFWKGKTIYDRVFQDCPPKTKHLIFQDPNIFPTRSTAIIDNFSLIQKGIGTVVPNYEKVLNLGLKGIVEEVQAAIDSLELTDPQNIPKLLFLKSVLTAVDGLSQFIRRYAALAQQLAGNAQNERRREELEKIAEVCLWVSDNPPRNFWEAVQTFWFTHLAVRIEESGHSLSPGRFDQYMFSFYDKDPLPEKEDFALELIECLFIKLSELMLFSSTDTSKFYTGVPQWQNLNLGGKTKEGRDATNAISYLCLDAMIELRLAQPDVSVRIHPDTPESFLIRACELARLGTGHPKFYNEDLIAHSMASKGLSLEDSRNFSIMGCVEPRVTNKEGIHLTGGFINIPAAVELALSDGNWRWLGKKIGLSTGEPLQFSSFNEFYNAFKSQLSHLIRHMFIVNALAENAYSELLSTPFLSALTEECIQRGKDLQHGGAIYNFGPAVNGIGIADTVDSIFAVKKLIFEQKRLTMAELLEAIEKDFIGAERVRNILLHDVPKFGNDEEEVDTLAHDMIQYFNEECMRYKNIFGGQAQSGIIPVTAGIAFGKVVGALPSGRMAGEPYADGSSPSAGNDKKGPTAILRSVARLDLARLRNGDLLNMRLNPTTINSAQGLKKMTDFIRGFCDVGGWHIQFNLVDTATLLDAQAHPEKYSDLLVRVAGYSAYFTKLHREVQDDIIRRTEHSL